MGTRGPIPKRSSERRRRNKSSKVETVKKPGAVKAPRVSSAWHPIAKTWFKSLAESGQADYYEPSDWQAARYVAEIMSRSLKAAKPSAQMFAAIFAAMNDLLTTEASRRRVRLEIERGDPGEEPAKVTSLDAYRAANG